jgi:hypothetical protein
MSYGTAAYGSVTYGSNANAGNEQIIFAYRNYSPDVLRESEVAFTGNDEFYSVTTWQSGEPEIGPIGTEYKIYTAHGEGETPQLQVTTQGSGQTVVGAAPRIVVTMIVDGSQFGGGLEVKVTGRPGS